MKLRKKPAEARELLAMLPEELFTVLSKKYDVDYRVKKLSGKVVFLTLLETLFASKTLSLRSMKVEYENEKFQKHVLKKKDFSTIHHTSFHYRLNKINPNYFREIFEVAKIKFLPYLMASDLGHKILAFDSTIVTHSAKLLKSCGYEATGKKTKKHIKYTIGYTQGIPQIAKSHTTREYHSENVALSEAILSHDIPKDYIIVFDRGLQHRETYDKITEKGNFFVGRLNPNYRIDVLNEKEKPSKKPEIDTKKDPESKITKELKGYLYGTGKSKKTKHPYRVIHSKPDDKGTDQDKVDKIKKGHAFQQSRRKKHANKTKEELYEANKKKDVVFVTNIPKEDISAEEIGEIYRDRWGIEVFFRFVKQELSFSHILIRSKKGIESVMYIIMVYAIVLLVFKKMNQIEAYRHSRRKFHIDSENKVFVFVKKIVLSRPDVGQPFKPQFW